MHPVYVEENTLEETEMNLRPAYRDENQFENCLNSENFFWGAGNYLKAQIPAILLRYRAIR